MLGNSAAVSKRSEVKYCASAIPRPRPLARTLLTVGATSIGVAVASLALQLGRGLQKETVTLSGPGLQGVRRPMKRLLSWAESLPSLRDNKIPMTFELRDEPARPHLLVQLPHLISSAELIAGTRTRESETLNPAGTPPQMNRIGRIGESASSDDESGENDSDNGLAYGSSHHLPSNSSRPSHFGASFGPTQTYSQDIPLNRKPSLVDPKLFGPVNSLRGFVRTPCGFERVDRNAVDDVRPHYEPSIAPVRL